MTDSREAFVELVTAGLLALTFVIYLLFPFGQGIAMLVGGLILLGSGAYQTSKGWHVSPFTWVVGIILTLGGLGLRLFLVGTIRINWLPIALLLVAACLVPAVTKLAGHPKMRHAASHFGIAWRRYRLIGVAELAAAAGVLLGLFWRPAGLLAAAGMVLLLIGALIAHRRAHDSLRDALPALVALAVSGVYLAAVQ